MERIRIDEYEARRLFDELTEKYNGNDQLAAYELMENYVWSDYE